MEEGSCPSFRTFGDSRNVEVALQVLRITGLFFPIACLLSPHALRLMPNYCLLPSC